ncbi:hypothetical protein EDC04DRAFT_2921751 [Pisolithus marmoratus]|nr:hypothetical protein EDC04DRAFT_2921751 [Pisolithus marmoratus]
MDNSEYRWLVYPELAAPITFMVYDYPCFIVDYGMQNYAFLIGCIPPYATVNAIFLIQLWVGNVFFWTVQVLLQARLGALYSTHQRHTDKVLFVMKLGFAIEVAVMLAVTVFLTIRHVEKDVQGIVSIFYLNYAALGAFELLLLCLAIFAGKLYSKESSTRLGEVILQGNIMYFFVNMFAAAVCAVLVWFESPCSLVFEQMGVAAVAISGTRVILDIRRPELWKVPVIGCGSDEKFTGLDV